MKKTAAPPTSKKEQSLPKTREKCTCNASRHPLLGNCLSCGRIACLAEGEGLCLHCSRCPIIAASQTDTKLSEQAYKDFFDIRQTFRFKTKTTPSLSIEEFNRLNASTAAGSKSAQNHTPTLQDQKDANSGLDHKEKQQQLQLARESMRKLIEFDKNNTRRTQIIDDSTDFFNTDSSWLTSEEVQTKQNLQTEYFQWLKQQQDDRKNNIRVSLNFSTGAIEEVEAQDHESTDPLTALYGFLKHKNMSLGQLTGAQTKNPASFKAGQKPSLYELKPSLYQQSLNRKTLELSPIYIPQTIFTRKSQVCRSFRFRSAFSDIIQGSDYLCNDDPQRLVDQGCCMAMKQPWASLLVAGIKTVEGRVWNTPHRGRLWISATSQPASNQDITDTHEFYRDLYFEKYLRSREDCDASRLSQKEITHIRESLIEFPAAYPTGVLLGCVDVVDVLPNDLYVRLITSSQTNELVESESSFVFVCENPIELSLKFPITNDYKIFPLDKSILAAAQNQIRAAATAPVAATLCGPPKQTPALIQP